MRALVIAPHPDDETLGCGGTIASLSSAGVDVYVIAVACHNINTGDDITRESVDRASEFAIACRILGVRDCEVAMHPGAHDTLHQNLAELVAHLESRSIYSLDQIRPDVVFIPIDGAFHQDHRIVHEAAFAACRSRGKSHHFPPTVLGFCGPEDHWRFGQLVTPLYFDISSARDKKAEALHAYEMQLCEHPHPRSLRSIEMTDTLNGARHGVDAAELFSVYRMNVSQLLEVATLSGMG